MLNEVSSYPLRNTHSHGISTLTPLYHFPDSKAAAHTTNDTTHTPATSPVLLQASESALLTSNPAIASHSPQAAAAPLSSPSIQPPPAFPTTDPPSVALELPSPSRPASIRSGVHTLQHASSDSAAIPSSGAYFGYGSVSPTTMSSISAPQTTSVPAHAMTAMDLPTTVEAMKDPISQGHQDVI
jgi:hypothetical protein